MKLRGERYAEPYTLSTGTTGTHRGIRYTFEVVDDRDPSTVTATERGVSSPVFHDPNMPIGEALAERWRQSREDLIREIFEP